MLIVINRCYGGFGLSNKAVLKLIKMKSSAIKKMSIKEYYGNSINWQKEFNQDKKGMKRLDKYLIHEYLSGQLYDNNYNNVSYVYSFNEDRTHPDLIKVIQELGDDANGSHAKLKIVEIPDNVKYKITEYDGIEIVDEVHRSWS